MSSRRDDKKQMCLEELIDHFGFGMYTIKLVLLMGALYFIDGTMLTVLSTLSTSSIANKDLQISQRHLLLVCGQVASGVGGFYWGWMSDKRGRRRIPLICCSLVLYFGTLDVVEDEFAWTCALRSVIGFSVGGAVVAPCIIAEITGPHLRARLIILLQVFLGLGVLFTSLASLAIDQIGPPGFLALILFPIPMIMISLIWLPESVQYLKHSEEYASLLKGLQQISAENKKPFPVKGMEVECHHSRSLRGKVSMLFNSRYVLKLLILMVTSFSAYFCYYNALIYHSDVVGTCATTTSDTEPQPNNDITPSYDSTSGVHCNQFHKVDHHRVFVYAAVAETIAPCLLLPVVNLLGRKKLLFGLFGFNILANLLSAYLVPSTGYILPFVLLFRAIAAPIIGLTTLFTVELFPTVVRACAVALCTFSTRLGIIAVGYTNQGGNTLSTVSLMMICIGLSLLSMLLVALLPETNGKYLDSNLYR